MLSKIEWLIKITKENPNLPIIPIVSDEITGRKSAYKILGRNRWFGSLGDAEILMYIQGNKNIHFYADCDFEETLVDCGIYTREEAQKLSVEELENSFEALPWVNAILLNIDCAEKQGV